MRGLYRARTPLSAARAFLAGAAILAGAATSAFSAQSQGRASDSGDDTALAIPRVRPGAADGGGVALPQPLDAATAARLRRAFQDAAVPLDGLADNLLLGHVTADRLLGLPRATCDELQAWLDRFPDLPDGPAIHGFW